MLDANLKQQVQTYLSYVQQPIELTAYVDDGLTSGELLNLVDELSAMSENIRLQESRVGAQRIPSLSISNPIKGSKITFAGVPTGHEFSSLMLALLHSGGHHIKESAAVQAQISALEGNYLFEIYVSMSCQNCPVVVQALNTMAAINPHIKTVMIDGALHPQEVEQRQVMAVPMVFLNGKPFAQGRISLEQILAKLDDKAEARIAEAINAKAPFDALVVGGGPAGAAAAIYLARKGIRTGVVADRFGGQVQDTLAIENFISVKATEGSKLAANLEQHVLDYDVDVMANQAAKALRSGEWVELELANGATLKSRSLIIATGARWREMNISGEQEYRGRGVAYCPHCDGPLFKGKRVAVIGGGNSGIEAAIDLAGITEHVIVLEFADNLRADEVLLRKVRSLSNVDIITGAQTTEVLGDGNKVTGLRYINRATQTHHELNLAGIFVQIGLMPNTDWLKESGIALTLRGEIEVDSRGQTTLPGVFAAGDVTNVPYKQIIIAMGSGASAALGAFDYLMRLPVAEKVAA